jgi:hypothetical protein
VKLAAAFALPLVISFALVRTATQVVGVPDAPTSAKSSSIVWANRVFVTRGELARWLRARGASYARWAQRHPALATGQQPTDAGLAQLDQSRTVRLLRSLVLGVAIAAVLLAALTPIANAVRHRRSRVYVPALPGYRRAFDVPIRAFVRTRAAAVRAAPAGASRYGTPVFPRDHATGFDRFVHGRAGWYVAVAIAGAALGALLGYALS